MDRQKSCGNDRLQVVMRAFHRYKYDKSYGVLLALIPTMRSDFDRKYCTIHQICSVGNSCEKVILRYRLLPQVSIFKLSYPNTFTKLEIWVPFACLS